MTSSPAQIRELLLKSIGKDAKVVDTEGVLKAISALEKMTITKEALEGTRLGKLVNNIRKAASDAKLKDRCKRLIQKWKNEFVVKAQAADSSSATSTGQSKGKTPTGVNSPRVSPSLSKSGGTPVEQTKSENRKRRKPDSPSTPPDAKQPSKKQSTGRSPSSTAKGSGKGTGRGSPSVGRRSPSADRESPQPKIPPVEHHDGSSPNSNTSPSKQPRKSKSGKIPEMGKDSDSLHKHVLKVNATKVATETTDEQIPLPKVKRKRGRPKKNGGASLSPRVSTTAVVDLDVQDGEPPSNEASFRPIPVPVNSVSKDDSIVDTNENIGSTIEELTISPAPDSPADSVESQDSSFSSHSKQIDKFSEEAPEESSIVKEDRSADFKETSTEEDVRKLHEEHWESMNGNYNSNGQWSSWEDCLVRDSGENHSLHILPYVCID